MARRIAADIWERRAMTWREREGLPDNAQWRASTRNAWERGDYDAEDGVQAALAAINQTTEAAAKLIDHQTPPAVGGPLSHTNSMRVVMIDAARSLRNGAHLKAPQS